MSRSAERLLAALLLAGCGASSSSNGPPAGGETGSGGAAGATGGGAAGATGGGAGVHPDAAVLAPDAAPPVDLAPDAGAEFCAGYAAKFCERLGGCSQAYLVGVYGDLQVCAERLELECRSEAAAAGTGLTAATATACGDALGGASCDDLFGGSVPACQWKGKLAAGAACGSGAQCASGFCRTPETSFCGKCDARAAEGAPCDSDDACQFPLLCSEAGRCAPPSGEGEFCNETKPCKTGPLFCGSDNTCRRPSAEGKPCNRGGNAPLQLCEAGFYCRPSNSGTCRAIPFVEVGKSCGISPTGTSVTLCASSGSCVNSLCKPPGLDGQPCTASPLGDSGGCLAPALCLEGLCKLPDPASCH